MSKIKRNVCYLKLTLPENTYEKLEQIAESQGLPLATYANSVLHRVAWVVFSSDFVRSVPVGKPIPPDNILLPIAQVDKSSKAKPIELE